MTFADLTQWFVELDTQSYILLLFAAFGVGSLISHFIALIRGSF
ncbi:hypothetical protein [Alcanivorax sp.]|nr:hypothetical protein [Alcanivorax sp.]